MVCCRHPAAPRFSNHAAMPAASLPWAGPSRTTRSASPSPSMSAALKSSARGQVKVAGRLDEHDLPPIGREERPDDLLVLRYADNVVGAVHVHIGYVALVGDIRRVERDHAESRFTESDRGQARHPGRHHAPYSKPVHKHSPQSSCRRLVAHHVGIEGKLVPLRQVLIATRQPDNPACDYLRCSKGS